MHPSRQNGFTLIELVVTLAIVAVLGLLTVPVLQVTRQRIKEQALQHALREIRDALDAYKRAADAGVIDVDIEASGYPATLEVLVDGVPRQENLKKQKNVSKLYFLRRIPRDPMDVARARRIGVGGIEPPLSAYQTDVQTTRLYAADARGGIRTHVKSAEEAEANPLDDPSKGE